MRDSIADVPLAALASHSQPAEIACLPITRTVSALELILLNCQ